MRLKPDECVLLIPTFNDWSVVRQLLPALDAAVDPNDGPYRVVLIDDGSTEPPPEALIDRPLRRLGVLDVLRLRGNLGHQRAIAVGIGWVEAAGPCRAVVIMDGDGEDAPGDVPRLLERLEQNGHRAIVFASRTRRSEGLLFRIFYALYRFAHLLLTGVPVRIGNFSAAPFASLRRLAIVPDLWNHYAASVVRARIPHELMPTRRAKRLEGRSKMNFVSLVIHGLSAISVFTDRVGVRMIVLFGVLSALTFGLMLGVAALALLTDQTIPSWATTTAGLAIVLLIQILTLLVVFVLIILRGRDGARFLPLRDYGYYLLELEQRSVTTGEITTIDHDIISICRQ